MPSALSASPQILGASALHDGPEGLTRKQRSANKDINNPVFGEDNESPYVAGKSMSNFKDKNILNKFKLIRFI